MTVPSSSKILAVFLLLSIRLSEFGLFTFNFTSLVVIVKKVNLKFSVSKTSDRKRYQKSLVSALKPLNNIY